MIDLVIGVPIVVALVEMIKRAGLSPKYAPLVSVVLGVGMFAIFGVGETLPVLFEGLIVGLSASGLYSTSKSMLK